VKVTRGELKQIINEELEAQILRENIISDLVDLIKDSGEDAADWVKKNAKKVAKAAASAGESVADFADDVVQGAMRTVDKAAGTKMSRKSKSIARRKAARRAQKSADLQAQSDEISARWAKEDAANKASDDALNKRIRDRERRANEPMSAARRQQYANFLKSRERDMHGDDEDDLSPTDRRAIERDWEERRIGSGTYSGYGESIDRDTLKKAIREELAKVLQGK
jgi:hypothetical protein